MSTRSTIAIKHEDGTINAIYCHFDGYFEGVGATLNAHYRNADKVKQLIALGNISALNEEIGLKQDFNKPTEDTWTLAYGRDRGETGQEASTFTSRFNWIREFTDSGCEYAYLYEMEEGRWLATPIGTKWNYLNSVLKTEKVNA
jgi:hypothetical protein